MKNERTCVFLRNGRYAPARAKENERSATRMMTMRTAFYYMAYDTSGKIARSDWLFDLRDPPVMPVGNTEKDGPATKWRVKTTFSTLFLVVFS